MYLTIGNVFSFPLFLITLFFHCNDLSDIYGGWVQISTHMKATLIIHWAFQSHRLCINTATFQNLQSLLYETEQKYQYVFSGDPTRRIDLAVEKYNLEGRDYIYRGIFGVIRIKTFKLFFNS